MTCIHGYATKIALSFIHQVLYYWGGGGGGVRVLARISFKEIFRLSLLHRTVDSSSICS